ncbi:MAG: ornithine carbamoyltransferase [Ktedonobacterales bacterium]
MRHLLTVADVPATEIEQLCAQAQAAKDGRRAAHVPSPPPPLSGCTVALLFEKPSLRTRVSFEVAAAELGATSLYLSPQEVGLGSRESVADVARVLSSFVHCVILRTFEHAVIEEFARHATIPVINGLSNAHHPCQGLTDVFTIQEQCGKRAGTIVTYLGDGNNCAHSLMQAAAALGIHLRLATPAGYEPDPRLREMAEQQARRSGGSVTLMTDPRAAALGADVLYTDVWTSMGTEHQAELREAVFAPYRLETDLVKLASEDVIVLHPLPAHRNHEISDAVIDGPHSRVFVQAENRLHMQKAILQMLIAAPTEATSARDATGEPQSGLPTGRLLPERTVNEAMV